MTKWAKNMQAENDYHNLVLPPAPTHVSGQVAPYHQMIQLVHTVTLSQPLFMFISTGTNMTAPYMASQ